MFSNSMVGGLSEEIERDGVRGRNFLDSFSEAILRSGPQ